jgi:hypothetical protein
LLPLKKEEIMNLSKSDFQLASNCSQKLLYKKRGYPTSNDSNEYMKMLAEGGYVVGHMATMLYLEGVENARSREHVPTQGNLLKEKNKGYSLIVTRFNKLLI